jgi:hypothetical protein
MIEPFVDVSSTNKNIEKKVFIYIFTKKKKNNKIRFQQTKIIETFDLIINY